jgi:phenylalanyl-tRNA synthetase beta chain
MLEMGQPMHAFDHKDIRGGRIIVRRARPEETIVTLDGKERALTTDMLLICDTQGAIGIAGIMGGENSEIKEDTTTVIFESAKFRQGNARRTARSLGLQTESAMRFSKGIDAAGCKTAMDRALHLVQLLGAGEIVPGEIDIVSADLSPRTVKVAADRVNAKLGTSLSAEEMAKYLNSVFISTRLEDGTLVCDIPSFRGDISMGDDIAEEVARMYGYNNIPSQMMSSAVKRGVYSDEEACVDKARRLLVNLGCFECVTYSFGPAGDYEKLNLPADDRLRCMVRILNPLGDEQAMMRTSPVPDMLKVVAGNLNRKTKDIRLFEAGRVYLPSDEAGSLPDERKYICIALCGDEDFFSMKGVVENLLEAYGIRSTRFMTDASEYYHPGRKASVYASGEKLGELGEIHPDVCAAFGIGKRVYLTELDLRKLCDASDDVVKYEPLPRFPAVERDVALIVDAEVPAGDLLNCIRMNAGPYFESAALFDVYTGDKLGAGKKSLAYTIVLRAKDRTLLDEEANGARDAVVAAAGAQFGAKLRD